MTDNNQHAALKLPFGITPPSFPCNKEQFMEWAGEVQTEMVYDLHKYMTRSKHASIPFYISMGCSVVGFFVPGAAYAGLTIIGLGLVSMLHCRYNLHLTNKKLMWLNDFVKNVLKSSLFKESANAEQSTE